MASDPVSGNQHDNLHHGTTVNGPETNGPDTNGADTNGVDHIKVRDTRVEADKRSLKAAVRNAYHVSYHTRQSHQDQSHYEPPLPEDSIINADTIRPRTGRKKISHALQQESATKNVTGNSTSLQNSPPQVTLSQETFSQDTLSQDTPYQENLLKEPLALKMYGALTGLSGWFAQKLLNRRLAEGKEDALRLHERRGIGTINRPEGSVIWIHGASVGESLSVLPLVDYLANIRPDLHFLVTTGTTTSASLMVDRLPENAFHQFIPIDYPPYVKSFLNHWKPDVAVFVESEFWPNLIKQTRQSVAMMAIVNGRVSPKSYQNWKRRPHSIRYLLSAFDLIIAQDHDNAARLRDLSTRDVMLFGNLKNAASPLPADNKAEHTLRKQMDNRPSWLAASTHPSEEEMIFDAHRILRTEFPDVLTMIAPRHPGRGDDIAQVAKSYNLKTAQRSKGDSIHSDVDIYIADTLGELGVFYRVNDIALVGGGLTPKGGHNPLEPARLENAILHGPHIFNFNETYNEMRRAGAAALVRNDRDIAAAVKRLLSDDKTRHALARLAGQTAHENAERILKDISSQLMEGINIACPTGETQGESEPNTQHDAQPDSVHKNSLINPNTDYH